METKNEYAIFCENVRRLRKKHKLSKREMAGRLHIGVKMLTMIENGVLSPRLRADVMIDIYLNFGMSLDDQLTRLMPME